MDVFKLEVTPEHLGANGWERLDTLVARVSTLSRNLVREQIAQGRVSLQGKITTKPAQKVRAGDVIQAHWDLAPSAGSTLTPIEAALEVVFEDEHLLVINKPQGLVVHPAPSHQGPTLVHHLLYRFQDTGFGEDSDTRPGADERPGIVHRLDKGTSGLLLVAKDRSTQERLSALFQARKVSKTYEALCWGRLPGQGRFTSAIGRDRGNRLKMSSKTSKGRDAITDWQAIAVFACCTHVRMHPHTGRTHQLRVHLSENGHPIVGDPLYGRGMTQERAKSLPPAAVPLVEALKGTLLHAAALRFTHPHTGQEIALKAPRPDFFDKVLQALADSKNSD